MHRATRWSLGILGGMALAGALAGFVWLGRFPFGVTQLAALLFVAIAASSLLAVQLHRRGMPRAVLVGGMGAALALVAFIAVPVVRFAGPGMDLRGLALIALFLPGAAGLSGACGTLLLVRGVDDHRRKHGMTHAPR